MSIVISWDNPEKTIIRWDFDGVWDWDEYGAVKVGFDAMLREVDHTVGVIADMRHSPTLPKNAFTRFKYFTRTTPPNRGLMVFVGTNMLVRVAVETLGRAFKELSQDIAFADTVEDARLKLTVHEHA